MTFVLTSFDIQDINMDLDKQSEFRLLNVIPECYSHILGNPEYINR